LDRSREESWLSEVSEDKTKKHGSVYFIFDVSSIWDHEEQSDE